ncbi:hypothetical protein EDC04DRAFT_2603665 [Pisolithus marmoratus]|nr:hypothetical protein EDC04DRAFT_2603665 [Pisolithus marmoratus]
MPTSVFIVGIGLLCHVGGLLLPMLKVVGLPVVNPCIELVAAGMPVGKGLTWWAAEELGFKEGTTVGSGLIDVLDGYCWHKCSQGCSLPQLVDERGQTIFDGMTATQDHKNIHQMLLDILKRFCVDNQVDSFTALMKYVHSYPDFHGNRFPIADP